MSFLKGLDPVLGAAFDTLEGQMLCTQLEHVASVDWKNPTLRCQSLQDFCDCTSPDTYIPKGLWELNKFKCALKDDLHFDPF